MNSRSLRLSILFSIVPSLFGQNSPDALANYLDELRRLTPQQRAKAFDSAEFQRNVAHRREIEETVFKPLLTGDLKVYLSTLRLGLNDVDPYIRRHTAELISFIAMNPEVYLIPDSARVRALGELVPSLIALTYESQPEEVRTSALESLARIVSTREPAIPRAFRRAVDDASAPVRHAGLLGLAATPQDQSLTLEVALKFLRSDPDTGNRQLAAGILVRLPSEDAQTLRALMAAIDDPSADVQRIVASALAKRAPGNREVTQLLERKRAQPNLDPGVRKEIEAGAEGQKQ